MLKTASDIADIVLYKLAQDVEKTSAITQEEIARGLSGAPGREDISDDETQALAQQGYDRDYARGSYKPWVGGGVGLLGGGALGAAAGGGPGAAIGAAAGTALGAGLGHLTRRTGAKNEQRFQESLGDIAQTGTIPYDTYAGDLERYIAHARGKQEDRIDPEALERFKVESARQQKQDAITGALSGALRGNMRSDQEGGQGELRDTLTGAAAGGLGEYADSKRRAGGQEDLHARGYGQLADMLRRRNVG